MDDSRYQNQNQNQSQAKPYIAGQNSINNNARSQFLEGQRTQAVTGGSTGKSVPKGSVYYTQNPNWTPSISGQVVNMNKSNTSSSSSSVIPNAIVVVTDSNGAVVSQKAIIPYQTYSYGGQGYSGQPNKSQITDQPSQPIQSIPTSQGQQFVDQINSPNPFQSYISSLPDTRQSTIPTALGQQFINQVNTSPSDAISSASKYSGYYNNDFGYGTNIAGFKSNQGTVQGLRLTPDYIQNEINFNSGIQKGMSFSQAFENTVYDVGSFIKDPGYYIRSNKNPFESFNYVDMGIKIAPSGLANLSPLQWIAPYKTGGNIDMPVYSNDYLSNVNNPRPDTLINPGSIIASTPEVIASFNPVTSIGIGEKYLVSGISSISNKDYRSGVLDIATGGAFIFGGTFEGSKYSYDSVAKKFDTELISEKLSGLQDTEFKPFIKQIQNKEGDYILSGTKSFDGFSQNVDIQGKIIQTGENTFFQPVGVGIERTNGIVKGLSGSDIAFVEGTSFEVGTKGITLPTDTEGIYTSIGSGTVLPVQSSSAILPYDKAFLSKLPNELKNNLITFSDVYSKEGLVGATTYLGEDTYLSKLGKINKIEYQSEKDIIESFNFKYKINELYPTEPRVIIGVTEKNQGIYYPDLDIIGLDKALLKGDKKELLDTYFHERFHRELNVFQTLDIYGEYTKRGISKDFLKSFGYDEKFIKGFLSEQKEIQDFFPRYQKYLKYYKGYKPSVSEEILADLYGSTKTGIKNKDGFDITDVKYFPYTKELSNELFKSSRLNIPKEVVEAQIKGKDFATLKFDVIKKQEKGLIVDTTFKDTMVTKIVSRPERNINFEVTSKSDLGDLSLKQFKSNSLGKEISQVDLGKGLAKDFLNQKSIAMPKLESSSKSFLGLAGSGGSILKNDSRTRSLGLGNVPINKNGLGLSSSSSSKSFLSSFNIQTSGSLPRQKLFPSSTTTQATTLTQNYKLVQPNINTNAPTQNINTGFNFSPPPNMFTPRESTGFTIPPFTPISLGYAPAIYSGRKRKKKQKKSVAPSFTAEAFNITGNFPKSSAFGLSPFQFRVLPKGMKGFM